MVIIDKSKCIKCEACVKDCIVKVLTIQADGFPAMLPENEPYCLNCQHCLAVCPAEAVNCHGVTAGECGKVGPLPAPEQLGNLLRQRRSIRQFKDEDIDEKSLRALLDSLAWTPTGCNVHNLHFTVIRHKEEMSFFRKKMQETLRFFIKTGILGLFYPKFKRYMDEVANGADVVFRNAPHMIVVSANKKSPCREADPWIALSYFDLLAQTLNIGTCWSGFAVHALKWVPSLRKRLGIPKGYGIAAVLLFGIPAVTYRRQTAPRQFGIDIF